MSPGDGPEVQIADRAARVPAELQMHEPLGFGYLHRIAVYGHQFTAVQDLSHVHPGHDDPFVWILSSTKSKNHSRLVVVAVVLVHRADLPVGVKTRPWHLRTDRSPELPEDPQLLLLAEH